MRDLRATRGARDAAGRRRGPLRPGASARPRVGVRGGNGYLGLRGEPEEGTPAHEPGVSLNGFHERWPVVYPEDAYGLARTGQTLVDVPDGTVVRLFADDEPVDLSTARCSRHQRSSTCDRRAQPLGGARDPRGRRLLVARGGSRRSSPAVAAIRYEVESLDGPVRVTVSSELVIRRRTAAPTTRGAGAASPRRPLVPVAARAAGTRAVLHLATRNSGLELACGMDHRRRAAGA